VQLTRLRLSGFKSFVDPTEFWIEPGLTGIVGPNGCGKSNLVEALRWVMGESSPKQMRGGEMDDVIFSGTAGRPPRNLAEVTVRLDNSTRRAPAPFNDGEEIEVSRRIERGAGSTYHINGKEVRARDVQLLFADAATGAHSTALVSQGQIGDLIKAKPIQRRAILEEAAGITGLHSRRHEAELRLRAAETNLERLDDVLATLEAQHAGLRRQARQANRYRRIGDHIRRAEAIVLHLRWTEATEALEGARQRLCETQVRVTDLTGRTSAAQTVQVEAAATLPDLRRAETEAAAALERLVVERERLDVEEARLAEARRDCQQRLAQIGADMEREKTLAADAAAALARLEGEDAALAAAQEGEEAALQAAAEEVAAAVSELAAEEQDLTRVTEQVAADEAQRAALERRIAECEGRRARLEARAADIARERAELEAEAADEEALERVEAAASDNQARLEELRARAEEAERALTKAQGAEGAARDSVQEAEARHAGLNAEAAALAEVLSGEEPEAWPPVIDQISVETGFEVSLGAALGEDLHASAHDEAPVRWEPLSTSGGPPPLPAGAEPLSRFVKAPAALARRLDQIGVVADEAAGRALRPKLAQGQRLVSRDGALWRWDGFTVAAGAPTPAAKRLSQRNRLGEVRAALAEAEAGLGQLRAGFRTAQEGAAAAAGELRQAQEAVRRSEREIDAARDAHAGLARQAAAHGSRVAALRDAEERIEADRAETGSDADEARAGIESLPEAEAGRAAAAALKQRLGERRAVVIERQSAHDRLVREAADRAERLAALAEERRSWEARADSAARQLGELDARLNAATAEDQALAQRPEAIAAERARLMDRMEVAERARRQAADELAEAEARLREADRKLRQEEGGLAEAREERVRAEAQVEQADQARQVVAARIAERLGVKPEEALAAGGLGEDAELPEIDAVEARLQRLQRERDNMGPVNLRAEEEAGELDEQIRTLQSERADLVSAISRLRQGIGKLNREGRDRLLAAFDEVDRHFRELFVRLFGGGRAHMKLTEADDPLEAGLEIFASPPGKRLQVLSLLSGGEQALTALALLFAVFLTNPAPVCVLDEVDAPLDDANVDRFCALIEELAHSSATRFVLVTHHRMTMARMDRLFGVTMTERGISQLVSVDLDRAEGLRATA
jgi:chromosome segregation protein